METERVPASGEGRFVELSGTVNTRDLGGITVSKNTRTRGEVFYRSDAPRGLTKLDRERLESLNLTTVIDLRQPQEIETRPALLARSMDIEYHNVDLRQFIVNGTRAWTDPYDITGFYMAAIDNAGDAFGGVLEILGGAPGSAMFYCTAGKDRTGLVAALLLELVGVPRSETLDDFALTHDRIAPVRERLLAEAERAGEDIERLRKLYGATPSLLAPALDYLDTRYGGAKGYCEKIGLAATVVAKLRAKLIAPLDSESVG